MSVRVVKGHTQIESCLHASKEKKKCQGSERGLVNIQLAAGQKKKNVCQVRESTLPNK
jgi:hypothetical protein